MEITPIYQYRNRKIARTNACTGGALRLKGSNPFPSRQPKKKTSMEKPAQPDWFFQWGDVELQARGYSLSFSLNMKMLFKVLKINIKTIDC